MGLGVGAHVGLWIKINAGIPISFAHCCRRLCCGDGGLDSLARLLALSVPEATAASEVSVPLATASLALLILRLLRLLIVPCSIAIHEVLEAAHC